MMSERERWIVYPLLFFTIALGLKAQMPQPDDLDCDLIQCKQLVVKSADGSPRVRIGSSPARSGEMRLFGADGRLALVLFTDRSGKHGMLETRGDERAPQTVIGSDASGGFLKIYGNQNIPSLFLGHENRLKLSGLLALNQQDQPFYLAHQDTRLLWGVPLPWVHAQQATIEEPGQSTPDDAGETKPAESPAESTLDAPPESASDPPTESPVDATESSDDAPIDSTGLSPTNAETNAATQAADDPDRQPDER